MSQNQKEGKIYFVGAGPGDPYLITLRAYEVLKNADVVIYTGSLINREILDFAKNAHKIDSHGRTVEEICELMREFYREGKLVVRLHDGDPSIFGSIKEQMEVLESYGIDFEIVPGVSSFLACASRLKTEFTVPDVTQTVVITRYPGKTPVPEDIKEIAKQKPTLIFFLSASLLKNIVDDLIDVGYPYDFPCALCYKVTWDDEKIIFGTLSDICDRAKKEGITSHALFIVSKVFTARGKRSFVYSDDYSEIVQKAKSFEQRKFFSEKKDKISDELKESSYGFEISHDVRKKVLSSIFKKGIAFLAITKGGIEILKKLKEKIDFADTHFFVSEKFKSEFEKDSSSEIENFKSITFFKNLKELIGDIFSRYDAICGVISVGAFMRIIAPHIRSKEEDPAVLAIDDAGRFVISLLSGHVGGANELAREIAHIIGATPVITTASDSIGTIPVDIFGREFGWKQEADHDTFVRVSSAVVNFERVALVQESGERFFKLPPNVVELSEKEFLEKQSDFSACLFITHRIVNKEKIKIPCVFYRPRVLCVGIGFDEGVKHYEFENFLKEVLKENNLSFFSVKKIATIDKKRNDPEFVKFAKLMENEFGIEFQFFTRDELLSVSHLVMNPSHFAEKYVGVPSVSEASAILSAGENSQLILPKVKRKSESGAGITFAVALSKQK
ncbi:Cobalt-precorrin-5A hydrolase [bacterium HR19]|nr:Cobalt-precorrin-5A hydrolase [bacterium HR19]